MRDLVKNGDISEQTSRAYIVRLEKGKFCDTSSSH